MIISRIELREIHLPLIHFFETSFGRTTQRRIILARVIDNDGAEGWDGYPHMVAWMPGFFLGSVNAAFEKGPPVDRDPVGAWDDAGQADEEGASFTGHNVINDFSWDTHCKVIAAAPGREFTWINHGPNGDVELVRWGYTFEPEGDGTKVTETWQVLPAYPGFVSAGNPDADVKARIDGMQLMAREGIEETLANLKKVAEA